MNKKLKRIFALTVSGELQNPTDEQLKKQINNNLTIMSWMWLLLLMSLYSIFLVKNITLMIFWAIVSVFILGFISSLHNSQKQNKILLEVRELKKNISLMKKGK